MIETVFTLIVVFVWGWICFELGRAVGRRDEADERDGFK